MPAMAATMHVHTSLCNDYMYVRIKLAAAWSHPRFMYAAHQFTDASPGRDCGHSHTTAAPPRRRVLTHRRAPMVAALWRMPSMPNPDCAVPDGRNPRPLSTTLILTSVASIRIATPILSASECLSALLTASCVIRCNWSRDSDGSVNGAFSIASKSTQACPPAAPRSAICRRLWTSEPRLSVNGDTPRAMLRHVSIVWRATLASLINSSASGDPDRAASVASELAR